MNAPSLLLHNATLIDGTGAGPRPEGATFEFRGADGEAGAGGLYG